MKRFEYQTFPNLDPHQINILRQNSTTVAYSHTNENTYVVATRLDQMKELKRKLSATTNQNFQPRQTNQPFRPQEPNHSFGHQETNSPPRPQSSYRPTIRFPQSQRSPRPTTPQDQQMYGSTNNLPQAERARRLPNQFSESEQTHGSSDRPTINRCVKKLIFPPEK